MFNRLYAYGDRNAHQRSRVDRYRQQAWDCDNPNCPKRYHYKPYCVTARNDERRDAYYQRRDSRAWNTEPPRGTETMKVQIKRPVKTVKFSTLNGGDSFIYANSPTSTLFMRLRVDVCNTEGEVRNAVSFPSGVCVYVPPNDAVVAMLALVTAEPLVYDAPLTHGVTAVGQGEAEGHGVRGCATGQAGPAVMTGAAIIGTGKTVTSVWGAISGEQNPPVPRDPGNDDDIPF